jgi:hypothetical protein
MEHMASGLAEVLVTPELRDRLGLVLVLLQAVGFGNGGVFRPVEVDPVRAAGGVEPGLEFRRLEPVPVEDDPGARLEHRFRAPVTELDDPPRPRHAVRPPVPVEDGVQLALRYLIRVQGGVGHHHRVHERQYAREVNNGPGGRGDGHAMPSGHVARRQRCGRQPEIASALGRAARRPGERNELQRRWFQQVKAVDPGRRLVTCHHGA